MSSQGQEAGLPGPARTRTPNPRAWFFPTARGYRRSWLPKDALAGLSAGAVVIPQAMAYATLADLPVEIGLYTCMTPMLVYALLGGSRAMSVSTTSTIATLTATTFVSAGIAATSPTVLADLAALSLLVGTLLLVARLFRLGALVENINEATLIGLKVGVGATVALGQVPKLLGVDLAPTGQGFVGTLAATVEAVPLLNVPTLALSLLSVALLVGLGRFAPRIPAQLLVVGIGILACAALGLPGRGVDVIEPVPIGLPAFTLPSFAGIGALLPGALAIAVMAFLESAAVARGIRRTSEPGIVSDRELLAAGAASFVGAFFQSMPAAGGFSQSAVNQRAGARSQVAGLVTVVLAVMVALVLAPVLDLLPEAILAAMVFVAVLGLIDVRGMLRLARISPIEFWIATVTAAIGLAVGLLPAVAAGVLFTLGAVLQQLNRPRISSSMSGPEVLRVVLEAPLYTANVRSTGDAIETELDAHPGARRLVLDASVLRVTSVTVLDALADLDRLLDSRGVTLELHGLAGEPLAMARKTRWWRGLEDAGRVDPEQ